MKEQVLRLLKEYQNYRSGAEISMLLGVSRTAVWKAIQSLRQDGHIIEAGTNRGYRLVREADLLSEQLVHEAFRQSRLDEWISQVAYTPKTDSTNLMARRAADSGAPDKSLFLTAHQQAGRGRRGRTWISEPNVDLTFSLLLRPAAEPGDLAAATLYAGLCTAIALNECLAAEQASAEPDPARHASGHPLVGLKWPNDLVSACSGKKIGGILTEMILEENRVEVMVIGIGINLNSREFPTELHASATSILSEFNFSLRRIAVLCQIMKQFAEGYGQIADSKTWIDQYRQYCLSLNRHIRVITADGQETFGKAIDIDPEGELVIIDIHGQHRTIRSGEVSVRGLLGYHPT